MKKLIVAESAGFCFGVQRSVEMAQKMLSEHGSCLCLGELIHNEDVVRRLENSGMKVIDQAGQVSENEYVMIRAHGVAENVYSALKERRAVIVDATCPRVAAIHKIVRNASEEGRIVFVVGTPQHPEVMGIQGWCERCEVFENPEQIEAWLEQNPEVWSQPVTMVCQTTQTRDNFEKCIAAAKKRCTNLNLSDTICNATSKRQLEVMQLAAQCDAMVVIGGRNSANTAHLAMLCKERCKNVQLIGNAEELSLSQLETADVVGLTAGASTPDWIIKEVRNKMSDEIKVEGSTEEKEMSFDEMLEETLKPIYNGDKVTGIVVAITGTEVSVDLGAKYSGFIPTTEFSDGEDAVKVGDKVEAVVVRVNDVEGTAQLSKKRLDNEKNWTLVEEAVDAGTVLEGVVTEENKGGIVVNVKGVRVFVPASQSGLPKDAELSTMLKQTVKLQITEVNKARKRVVGSIRKVSQAERRARIDSIWNDIEKGKKYHGTVKSLTSYGAFVDIGGIDGMVHVSELSWGRITKPADVVAVGDEIDVYVIDFDKEKRRISLGYKDPNGNPWAQFMETYAVGDVASVTVVKLMQFGAFAEVVPGVDGLIHISQIANHRVEKPEDVLKVGDVVNAKITAIDEENHKISLSIRAALQSEAAAEDAE